MSSTSAAAKIDWNPEGDGEPIADVLTRVRAELDFIASSIDKMQSVVGELTWDIARLDPDYMRAMQSVDHSAQVVAGLGEFLVALVKDAPQEWRINADAASSIVTLADLAARLKRPNALSRSRDESGDFEMF